MKSKKVPKRFQALFPSIEVSKLDIEKEKYLIIAQLLHSSTLEGWKWMIEVYTKEDIKKTIMTIKTLKERDISYWKNELNLKSSEIACLKPKYQRQQGMPLNY